MTRYVGTGEGSWAGDWYRYTPSPGDRALAAEVAAGVVERVRAAGRRRTSYGSPRETKASWVVTGFLGEIAAFHAVDSGPDLDAWNGTGWYGRADLGRVEVRTTSTWQLYGFALAGKDRAGLGGWPVFAKDAGRILVAVVEDDRDYRVMGWVEVDEVPRLEAPFDTVLAIVEPPELRDIAELYRRRRVLTPR